MARSESPGLVAAKKALRAPTGKADSYRPPVSVLDGPQIRILPGQLDLDGHEHGK